MAEEKGLFIHIEGIVQGVGFRPFVFSLADRFGLKGWVRNTSAGVEIEVDGEPGQLSSFLEAISEEAPPLAKIDAVHTESRPANNFTTFKIIHSEASSGGFQPISPDVSICDDCLEELFTPDDHRYRYPFINCTNCGPRFTIIKDIPYDRPQTTMAPFEMCSTCAAEYEDPLDRRFHAQPVACPDCGPRVWWDPGKADSPVKPDQASSVDDEAIRETQNQLADGKIIAVKGLGGFHLACDAQNHQAVERLRKRKARPQKPLALMMPDLETVSRFCSLSDQEREVLTSPARPIILLEEKKTSSLSGAIAPGQDKIGIMLPYTPLHYLLFAKGENFPDAEFDALVMTSGNQRSQPIVTSNDEALKGLKDIADGFLLHDRDIYMPCDDSVTQIVGSEPYPVRRSRGYAPYPIQLPQGGPSILAAGPELKNTFCLTKRDQAFLSQHLGDMGNYQTLEAYQEAVLHFESLFRADIRGLAYDLHPNYLATRYALERSEKEGIPAIGVQHHFAHIASCLAENQHPDGEPVIGFAFDGTGYGDDGNIWGGEVFIADYQGYHRAYHISYVPLPGGDKAVKEPWRLALTWLHQMGINWDPSLTPVRYAKEQLSDSAINPLQALRGQLVSRTYTPLTSSMGRLFDAVSALVGVSEKVNYEGQAAIELEARVDPDERSGYSFDVSGDLIHPQSMIRAVLADIKDGVPVDVISARFHNGLAEVITQIARRLRKKHGLHQVALSGGVWQNVTLLQKTLPRLREEGFEIYLHRLVPPNDGGLSLGQAVVAQRFIRMKGESNDVFRRTR
ncbi:MAG: carbamoyltransferase HypF [Anaerolineales bacterium]|nr:carbamoyltransferase HypF [Anaerolineales bacterium]